MSITFKCKENDENELTFSELDNYSYFFEEDDDSVVFYKLNNNKNNNCLAFDSTESDEEIYLYDIDKDVVVTLLKVDIVLKFVKD
jgi:hypothetical protein